MTEAAVKSNQKEAIRLFERGVAAARGGQRRLASVMLSRAVQYDPHHEQAWLWLSGVIDDPKEIAFCLRSVLSINPKNERARQGLLWLEQRAKVAPQPVPAATPSITQANGYTNGHVQEYARESWWVNWRKTRREMNRAWLFVWATCIIVLMGTLGLNIALRDAVEHNEALAHAAAIAQPVIAQPTAAPLPAPEPLLQSEPIWAANAHVVAYLSVIEAPRAQLNEAVQAYREATSRPGGSSIGHASAARNLRRQVEATRDLFAGLHPPPVLEEAHVLYLSGLEQELAALDDMLEFYGSFSIQFANRATLRMEDASIRIERARAMFDEQQAQVSTMHVLFAQTAR